MFCIYLLTRHSLYSCTPTVVKNILYNGNISVLNINISIYVLGIFLLKHFRIKPIRLILYANRGAKQTFAAAQGSVNSSTNWHLDLYLYALLAKTKFAIVIIHSTKDTQPVCSSSASADCWMERHYSHLKKLLWGIFISSTERKGCCSSSGQH